MNQQLPQANPDPAGGTARRSKILLIVLIIAALIVIGVAISVRQRSSGGTVGRTSSAQRELAAKLSYRAWQSGNYFSQGQAARSPNAQARAGSEAVASSLGELVSADPESVKARVWYGVFLGETGRDREALAQIDEARRRLSEPTQTQAGAFAALARLYDATAAFGTSEDSAAIKGLGEAVDLGVFAPLLDKKVYERLGDKDRARAISTQEGAKGAAWLLKLVVVLGAAAIAVLAGLILGIVHLIVRAGSEEPRPRGERRLPAARLLALFLVFLALTLGIPTLAKFVIGLATGEEPGEVSARFIVTWTLCENTAVAAFCIWITAGILARSGFSLRDIGLRAGAVLKNVLRGAGGYLVALPIMVAAVVVSYMLFVRIFPVESPPNPIIDLVAAAGDRWVLVGAFLLGSLVAPVVEEIFFRGVLQNIIRAKVGAWGGILGSSAVFAGLHPQLPVGLLPLFGIGCVLAYLYEMTDSLVPSMVAHSLNNTVATVVALQLMG